MASRKVPYIFVREDLSYSFKFDNRTHFVYHKSHGQKTHSSVLKYAKQHAEKVFFKYYLNKKELPYITMEKIDGGFKWSFFKGDLCFDGISKGNKNEVFSIAVHELLKEYNVGGVGD